MKLAQFNALCDREWEKQDRGGRGDVVSLSLTGPSLAELTTDVLTSRDAEKSLVSLQASGILDVVCGASLSQLHNPVTRSVVKIRVKQGGTRESARVAVMGGTCRMTWWPAGGGAGA